MKSIFKGVLDFNLLPHPGVRDHGIKADTPGYLCAKYEYFLVAVVNNLYTKLAVRRKGAGLLVFERVQVFRWNLDDPHKF